MARRRAGPAAARPRPAAGVGGPRTSRGSSTSRCSKASTTTAGRCPTHHAFTTPHPDDIDRLESDPLSVRSRSYDLVLNGWELGSGSVRIHRPDMQQRIFSLLGIDPDDAQQRFGFLLDAFRFGAPPHAGFAVGIDRFAAILAGEENIREVIAFPKTQSGVDPLTNAPTPDRRPPNSATSASDSSPDPDPQPRDQPPHQMVAARASCTRLRTRQSDGVAGDAYRAAHGCRASAAIDDLASVAVVAGDAAAAPRRRHSRPSKIARLLVDRGRFGRVRPAGLRDARLEPRRGSRS